MRPSIRAVALAIAAATLVVAPAFAGDHGHNKHDKHDRDDRDDRQGNKHRHDHYDREVRQGAYFSPKHREDVHRYYTERYGHGRHCPPGLAKKNNGCIPPGHARRWEVGQPIPSGVTVYVVPQPVLVQLPPAPVGHSYSRLGGDIVLRRGNVVVDVMFDIFN